MVSLSLSVLLSLQGDEFLQSKNHNIHSWMNRISAVGEARRYLTNSTSIATFNSVVYIQGTILIFSKAGEFASKNFISSISWDTPHISVIFTIFNCLNVQSEGHSIHQKSKLSASSVAFVFEDP